MRIKIKAHGCLGRSACAACGHSHFPEKPETIWTGPMVSRGGDIREVGRLYQLALGLPDGGPYRICPRCHAMGCAVVRVAERAGLLELSEGWFQ